MLLPSFLIGYRSSAPFLEAIRRVTSAVPSGHAGIDPRDESWLCLGLEKLCYGSVPCSVPGSHEELEASVQPGESDP